jgi:hypothetical protein
MNRTPARAGLLLLAAAAPTLATDIPVTQFAALDQPRINAAISLTPTGDPLVADIFGTLTFNITAFYDTGASGVLLSAETSDLLEVARQQFNGQDVIFSDIGVGGSDDFYVSNPLYIRLADYHPNRDVDNLQTYQQTYTQTFGPIRTQIGPITEEPNPLLQGLDVFGMPTFTGKVVVFDPKPVNTFQDTMRTYVYDPGTPFRPDTADSDPGIPQTHRSIQLSYVSFDRFTTTNPPGAPGPSLRNNPFLGPNPFASPFGARDRSPPVKISYNGRSTEGSWLLDTGAAASILSRGQAERLGVSYVPGSYGTDDPVLAGVPLDEQFTLRIGGIGGTIELAGFYLDSLLLRTREGNRFNDDDPAHIRYLTAPVIVGDITVADAVTGETYTLDGIFGMNFLVASAYFEDAFPIPIIGDLTENAFDWIVFDDINRTLDLQLRAEYLPGGVVPEPTSLANLALAAAALLGRRRR